MSRGLRNNNPGNIRINPDHFQGEIRPGRDKEFKQFDSMAYGYRAMLKMLRNYRKNRGLKCLREWISRWAPANENDTEAYILYVAGFAGISADAEIDTSDRGLMCRIVAGMSQIDVL
ncbi:MAG: structural protein P5 [Tannerellaceae bacterium]|jgi:hypothetical protein|nr:structural protein P5 [Tannerellaceae bacterium]